MHAPQARLGTVIGGRFRLEAVIGSGGFATVYSARDRDGVRFAVKLIDPANRPVLGTGSSPRSQLFLELHVSSLVRHPGVVRVHTDGETDDGSSYVVMEYLEGLTADALSDRLGKLPPSVVAALLDRILDLLTVTHAAGIIHHDVNPNNVFVMRSGIVKLLDFGISTTSSRDHERRLASVTAGAMMLGTYGFMSPEKCRGERGAQQDPRVDIWSVGATAFALLSGRAVYGGEAATETIFLTATRAPPSLGEVVRGIPPTLAALVDRALAFDADQRFQTASEMRDVLLTSFPHEHDPAVLLASVLKSILPAVD